MTIFEEAVFDALMAIDDFLCASATSPGDVTATMLRDLSFKIERARVTRTLAAPSSADFGVQSVQQTYRVRLLQLQARLRATEVQLRDHHTSLAEERQRLQYVQEWHEVFRTTQ